MNTKEKLDIEHRAIYTSGETTKEVMITRREIVQYGLKRVIRYHATILGLTKYHCHVEGLDEEKTIINK